tara:strand:+ start:732 stop:1034 length:303 start_codon:yes stop_codon:yes gene_type:complete
MKHTIKSNESVSLVSNPKHFGTAPIRTVHDLEVYMKHGWYLREDKKKEGWVAVCVNNDKGGHSNLFTLNKEQAFNMAFHLMNAVRIFEDYEMDQKKKEVA